MILFDGKTFAAEKELLLKHEVDLLHAKGKTIRVTSVTFKEDEGSILYTGLKKKAAERIGILYEPYVCSLADDQGELIQNIRELSFNASVTGVMIQKPAKAVWEKYNDKRATTDFAKWWESLTTAIDPQKDIDCLTQQNLNVILSTRAMPTGRHVYSHEGRTDSFLVPATVKAVLSILQNAKNALGATNEEWMKKSVLVIGKSDIVGKPLTHLLRVLGHTVVNVGKQEFEITKTQDFPIIICAAGQADLLKGEMVGEGAVVIDVGSPAADVENFSVEPKASFLTPVPGGVGPVTVISLMENIVKVSTAL